MNRLLSESGWYPEFSRVDEAATRNDTKTELVEGTHHPLMLGNTHPLAAWLSLSLSPLPQHHIYTNHGKTLWTLTS